MLGKNVISEIVGNHRTRPYGTWKSTTDITDVDPGKFLTNGQKHGHRQISTHRAAKTAVEVKEVKVERWDWIMSLCPQHQQPIIRRLSLRMPLESYRLTLGLTFLLRNTFLPSIPASGKHSRHCWPFHRRTLRGSQCRGGSWPSCYVGHPGRFPAIFID